MIRRLELSAWAGQWVALDVDDQVCYAAPTSDVLLDTIASESLVDVEILRVRIAGEPVYASLLGDLLLD